MGLAAVISSAFAAAHAASLGVQVDVSFEAIVDQDAFGKEDFAPAVGLKALVQMDPSLGDGQELKLLAIVTFLEPVPSTVPANPKFVRQGPIDSRDRIVFQDGRTGPIVNVFDGMVSEETGLPFAHQVEIGRG